MIESMQPVNLLSLDREGFRDWFGSQGEQSWRADQVMQWIYHHRRHQFADMTNLSKDLRQRLAQQAVISLPEVAGDQVSTDGTRKWLLRLDDGNCIETVFIPETDRGTLCVSSQVGCALNCTFCATARQGYNRNLRSDEIVSQVIVADGALGLDANGRKRITNVVMMGMGEPLLNFDAVTSAMKVMMDDFGFGLSRRRVTLSTAGMVPGIDRLRDECPVSLAVSLHAPNDELRTRLVPLNRKYPIKQLLEACVRYVSDSHRARVTFEYVMLDGVNDSPEHAKQLARLLEKVPSKINLIPFNPFAGIDYQCSRPDAIEAFRDVLYRAGLMTITRKTRGQDIEAACGQLAGRVQDRTSRSVRLESR